jgi:hypothetical protein
MATHTIFYNTSLITHTSYDVCVYVWPPNFHRSHFVKLDGTSSTHSTLCNHQSTILKTLTHMTSLTSENEAP